MSLVKFFEDNKLKFRRLTWDDILNAPITLAGYGITDAYTKTETDANIATAKTGANLYTDGAIANLLNGSPEALDTLWELANALGNDPNFATTVMEQIGLKLDASEVVSTPAAGKVLRLDSSAKLPWSVLSGTPTTLAGYGITDAYTKTEVNNTFAPKNLGIGGFVTSLYSTTDINTVSVGGRYYCNSCVNIPSGVPNGFLDVISVSTIDFRPSVVVQKYTSYYGVVYERINQGGTWSAWRQLAFTDNPAFKGLTSIVGTGIGLATSAQLDLVNTTASTGRSWSITSTDDGSMKVYDKNSNVNPLIINNDYVASNTKFISASIANSGGATQNKSFIELYGGSFGEVHFGTGYSGSSINLGSTAVTISPSYTAKGAKFFTVTGLGSYMAVPFTTFTIGANTYTVIRSSGTNLYVKEDNASEDNAGTITGLVVIPVTVTMSSGKMQVNGSLIVSDVGIGGVTDPKATLHSSGSTILGTANTTIDDADIGNNQTNIYLDETNNKLKFRVRKSDGTYKTGEISLV